MKKRHINILSIYHVKVNRKIVLEKHFERSILSIKKGRFSKKKVQKSVISCILINMKRRGRSEKEERWLLYASDKGYLQGI